MLIILLAFVQKDKFLKLIYLLFTPFIHFGYFTGFIFIELNRYLFNKLNYKNLFLALFIFLIIFYLLDIQNIIELTNVKRGLGFVINYSPLIILQIFYFIFIPFLFLYKYMQDDDIYIIIFIIFLYFFTNFGFRFLPLIPFIMLKYLNPSNYFLFSYYKLFYLFLSTNYFLLSNYDY
jgi:hypothetical protein